MIEHINNLIEHYWRVCVYRINADMYGVELVWWADGRLVHTAYGPTAAAAVESAWDWARPR